MSEEIVQSKSNALSTTREQLSEHSLAKMLMLTAQVTGREMIEDEIRFWKEVLRGKSPQAIEAGFTRHLRASNFFPKPAEILKQIEAYNEERRQEIDNQEWADYKKREAEYLANGGELISLGAVLDKMKDKIKAFPVNDPMKRKSLQERIAKFQAEKKTSA